MMAIWIVKLHRAHIRLYTYIMQKELFTNLKTFGIGDPVIINLLHFGIECYFVEAVPPVWTHWDQLAFLYFPPFLFSLFFLLILLTFFFSFHFFLSFYLFLFLCSFVFIYLFFFFLDLFRLLFPFLRTKFDINICRYIMASGVEISKCEAVISIF